MITRALEQNNRSWAACARALEWTSPTCTGWRSVWAEG
jgi:transcriptional regulator with GAF, ATPase, and Fis domain